MELNMPRSNFTTWVDPAITKQAIADKVKICGSINQVGQLLDSGSNQIYRWYSGDQLMPKIKFNKLQSITEEKVYTTHRTAKAALNSAAKKLGNLKNVADFLGLDNSIVYKYANGKKRMKLCYLKQLQSL